MMNRVRYLKFAACLAGCLAFAAPGLAQEEPKQQDESKPKPAAKAYGPIGAEDQDANQAPDALQPDGRPLTGMQQPTIGTPMERHNYWVPGLSYYNLIQSNGQTQGGSDQWGSTSYVSGNVSLLQHWSRSQLMLNASGGGYFSTDSEVGNGWFSQIGATQTIKWRRFQLTLLDEFAYLPQSQFGFGAGTEMTTPGIGGSLGGISPGVGGGLNPGQSIFSAIGPRYMNTLGVQTNYDLTPRSSVTLGGIFGILRFTEPGNVDDNNYVGIAGYNFQITREDTIGVQYRFSSFHYIGSPQAIGDHVVQAVYGRKITGRLALQLSGGPEITNYRIPVGNKSQFVSGSGGATFTYALPRGSVSLSYSHGVTSGSGVFFGAVTDQLTVSGSRKLSRVWTGDAHVGFAHNRQGETAEGTAAASYNTVYVGGALARPLGRNAGLSLGYTAYVETSDNAGATSITTHQISVGLSWHSRPFVLH